MAEGDGFCTFRNTNVHSQMSQVVSSSSDMFVYLLCTYLREKKNCHSFEPSTINSLH